ncbi:MAG TPA: Xaa-Pro peptidase family protein [Thermoanaerobaculia bacterium]|nr:Xaa-Pro peptidase family protein [Thermoanaerobaculia bacterium]
MLADLDTLMQARGIDTVIVPMHEQMHASFRWLTRGAKVTRGYAIKMAGRAPILVTYPMEREEALATGLEVRLVHEFTSRVDDYEELYANLLRQLGSGKTIAFFGNVPVQLYLGIIESLEVRGWRVHRSRGEDLVQRARKRKEPWEVEAIRGVGTRTEVVVDGVRAMLAEAERGLPMTLGDLKQFVSQEIARLGMIEDHETILSQGRDAGVPHSRGDASAPVRLSVPLVLDIFPADKSSGYFFDLTRTFCIGPIPDELARLHAEVLEAFALVREAVRPGTPAASYQALVCDFFEGKGYATGRSNPKTVEGYVHLLGHGVGLDIHEAPSFSLAKHDLIEEGDVIAIEPGLYFPNRELGVRIEDTFVVTKTGVETLCRSGYGLECGSG